MNNVTHWCPLSRLAEAIGDRWSLLVLRELASGPQRFKNLKENIVGISMDQLSRKLDALCENYFIVRQEFSEAPPRVEYQLTDKGQSFVPLLAQLASWVFENGWDQPKFNEEVDVGLSLKTIATLFGSGAGTAMIRIFYAKGGDYFLVHRTESGLVKVSSSDKHEIQLTSDIDVTLELRIEDWIILMKSKRDERVKIRGHISGNRELLKKIFPFFERVDWIDTPRATVTFDELGMASQNNNPNEDTDKNSINRKNSVRTSLKELE